MFRNMFVLSGLRISAVVSLFVITAIAAFNLSGCGGSSASPSVAVTTSAATVDGTDVVTLTATVTNDKNSAGVTWSVSGGGTLSNQTTSGATYTAPTASSSALTVTVTATSVADTSKTGTATITVPAAPAITTTALTATVGTAFSTTLAGSGGIPPYTWSLTNGTLPTGWSLTAAGLLSGPAPVAGEVGAISLTFKLTDSGTATPLTTSQQLTLTINAAPAITFTGTMPATATYNVTYTGSAAATGGASTLTYSSTGSLPTGLSLNTSTGAITGTPTAVGAFGFTVKAADAFGDSQSQAYSITVTYPPVKVTAATLPVGYVGSTYPATTLAATGGSGTGYTWALANGSLLPAGMNLSAAGVISGKPTATTPTSFTVTATDSASNTANGTFSITVNAAVSITTGTALPTGYVASNYSQTLAATGGSGTGYTWTVTSGSTLPGGLSLSAAGVLSGKPTATGTPSFSITVTDSASNTASATFSMTIAAGVSMTVPTLPVGYPGTAYPTTTLTATGGTNTGYSWTWAAASGSTLPAGLSISTAGVISGTPTNSTTSSVVSSVVVTVTDSVGNTASTTISLTIQATLAISTGATLPGSVVNTLYSDTLAATGGSGGYTWSTNSAGTASLAAVKLTLSAAGVVSGTPLATGTATFTAVVTDSASHTASLAFSVTVSNLLTVTTTSLPATDVGASYSQTLAAAGGSGTGYTWTATSSNLASYGLSLSAAGVVSGTPTQSGTASFTAKVTDSGSNTATAPLTITIYGELALPTPNPTSLGSATTNASYNGYINASGGSGTYTWTVSGLSDNLTSSNTGGNTLTISGTPTSATTVSFTAKVTDATTGISVGPYTYTITVNAYVAVSLSAQTMPTATVGQNYSAGISASGGVQNYTFTVNTTVVGSSPTLLNNGDGLSGTASGGNTLSLSGSPTTTGTITLNVSVVDGEGKTASQTYTINAVTATPLSVTINSVPQGMVNMPYTYNGVSYSGGTSPYIITYTGAPAGLSKDSNSNLVGTPTAAATTTVTVKVTDSSSTVQTVTKTFSLTVVPETVAAHNGYLTGQYACYFNQYWDGGVTGGDGTSTLYRGGGVFAIAVNGSGSITGGEVDHNSPDSGYSSASTNGAISGTYAVGSDNRGYLSFTVGSSQAVIFALAGGNLSSSEFSEFAITEMDDAGASPSGQHGGGHCYKQITTPSLSGTLPSGGYVFSLTGEDSGGSPESIVGSMQFTAGAGSGTLTGVQDVVDDVTVDADMSISGTTATADLYGRVTMAAGPTGGGGTNPTVLYLTNNTKGEAVVMSAQPHNGSSNADFIIGEARKQFAANIAASHPFSGAGILYTEGTNNNSGSTPYKSMVIQFTGSSSAKTITINSSIKNNGGTFTQDDSGDLGTSTYTVDTTTGRATMTSPSGKGGAYFYLYDTNSAAVLFDDGTTPENLVGWIEPQTAPTSGTWAASDFATSYFMYKIDNGNYNNDSQTSVLTLDSSGTISSYAEDDGGWNWASWDGGMTGNNGTTETAVFSLDSTDGTYGLFDVKFTEGATTTTQSYCFAISADAASNSSSTKGKLVCMDASSDSPKLSIIQE
jgi:hypothetical protein